MSVSNSFNPTCDDVDGRRIHEPGGSEGDFRMRSGAGKAVLNGEMGVMRRASNPAWRRAMHRSSATLAVLATDVLLPLRECP